MHTDASGIVSGLTFTDLDIRDVRVGISVYGEAGRRAGGGSCNGVTMINNYIENMKGGSTGGGAGYGLHNDGCTNVRITENEIRNAERHSIYQAYSRGPVTIDHNLLINHRCGVLVNHTCPSAYIDNKLVALVVARSADVVVANNVILNPWGGDAMSAELDDTTHLPTPNIRFIHNVVLNAHANDLYISTLAADTVQKWGNVFVHRGSTGSSAPAIRGSGYTLVDPKVRWANTQVLDAVKDGNVHYSYPYSFVMQNNVLHEVNTSYNHNFDADSYWTYTGATSQTFPGFRAMVAGQGGAYIMNSSNQLQKLIPNRTGTQTTWSSQSCAYQTFNGFQGMAWTTNSDPADLGSLFIVGDTALYQVAPPNNWTGSCSLTQGTTNWRGIQAITAFNDYAYIMQNNVIHKIRSGLNSSPDYIDYWY